MERHGVLLDGWFPHLPCSRSQARPLVARDVKCVVCVSTVVTSCVVHRPFTKVDVLYFVCMLS